MAQGEEFDERITSVERQVRIAREDAAAARVLAGGADRDGAALGATLKRHEVKLDRHEVKLDRHEAKLDVHKALLDALREAQIEQGEKIDSLERRMSQGFSMLAVGQAEILALLNRMDDAPSS